MHDETNRECHLESSESQPSVRPPQPHVLIKNMPLLDGQHTRHMRIPQALPLLASK